MASNNNNNQQQQQQQLLTNMNQSIQNLAQNKSNNMTPILKEYAKEYAKFQQQQQQFNNINIPSMNGGNGHGNHMPQRHNNNKQQSDQRDNSDLDNTNLYIKGLWKDCTQVDLDDIFKQFGVIAQSRVYGDGVGFVRFEQGFEAKAV